MISTVAPDYTHPWLPIAVIDDPTTSLLASCRCGGEGRGLKNASDAVPQIMSTRKVVWADIARDHVAAWRCLPLLRGDTTAKISNDGNSEDLPFDSRLFFGLQILSFPYKVRPTIDTTTPRSCKVPW